MTHTVLSRSPLSSLEARLHRGRYLDGGLDFLVGLAVLVVALDLFWGEAYGLILLAAIGPFAWRELRRRVVEPRLGLARFTAERRERQKSASRRLALALGAAALVGVASYWLFGGGGAPSEVRLPYGLGLSALVAGVGLALDQRRFLAYAALVTLGFTAAIPFSGRATLPWTVGTAGIAIALCGLWRFGIFLARNPLPQEEGDARA